MLVIKVDMERIGVEGADGDTAGAGGAVVVDGIERDQVIARLVVGMCWVEIRVLRGAIAKIPKIFGGILAIIGSRNRSGGRQYNC